MNADAPLDELIRLLPHRPPFRFVDHIDSLESAVSIVARYHVTGEEAFLAGHFPGRPTFPGVLQVEALAQAGAIAVLSDPRYADSLPLLGGVDRARFRREVTPGDELTLTVQVDQLSARAGRATGTVMVDGARTAQATLLFVLAPR